MYGNTAHNNVYWTTNPKVASSSLAGRTSSRAILRNPIFHQKSSGYRGATDKFIYHEINAFDMMPFTNCKF